MRIPYLTPKLCVSSLLSVFIFSTCSPKLAPEGHYQETPVVADGSADDWALPLRFSNAAYTMQYNVTNDDKNLYVCVVSNDDNTQLRILRSGMTIYFDPKGKKDKDISLHFPIQKQPDPGSNHTRYGGSSAYGDNGSRSNSGYTSGDRNTRKEELLLQSDYYNTTGFLDLENGQFSVADQKGPIKVAMKLDHQDSLLVYEVIVPIKNILGESWMTAAQKKNFTVGVFIDATPGTGGGGGGRPGGFGGMRGMGMRGMGGGGGGGRYGGGTPGQKEDANWYEFRLAVKSNGNNGNKAAR
jgi:hypothetical protein